MDRYGSITFDANEFKEALADDFDETISLISNLRMVLPLG